MAPGHPLRACSDTDPIGAYWMDVRPQIKKRRKKAVQYPMPDMGSFVEWGLRFTEPERASLRVLPGATLERAKFVDSYLSPQFDRFRPDCIEDLAGPQTGAWIEHGVLATFTQRFEHQPVPLLIPKELAAIVPAKPRWQILWNLILVKDFLLDGAIRDLADHEGSLLNSIYRALWEARFLAREDKGPERLHAFMSSVVRWLTDQSLEIEEVETLIRAGVRKRVESFAERTDALMFLLVLAEQNAVINRALYLFDNLEAALAPNRREVLRELDEFAGHADRWVRKLNCPAGIVIGFDANAGMPVLKRCSAKLHKRIEAGLDWTC